MQNIEKKLLKFTNVKINGAPSKLADFSISNTLIQNI